ncbi:unnamed protein product [Timema podura]|uniref:FAM86 N-terminal domain-containing protein n=1 Tax=Timema podura TaxID=61482 RepID=A0ABN7NSQ9_TIMPD|nr:unnamed protein product [Timema podura]
MSNTQSLYKEKIFLLQKQFFCAKSKIRTLKDEFGEEFYGENLQNDLLRLTINHPVVKKFQIKISYQVSFLKSIITQLENAGVDVCDDLYSAYCSLLSRRPEEDGTHYKHYLLSNYEEDIITLKESCSLVSQGTTGLCSWQAAQALAEWCVTHRLMLAHKEILELGSGVGLTGLTVSLCCRPRSFHFSDCHPAVLQFLCHNVALNAKHPAKTKPSKAEDGHTRTSQEDCKIAESPCNRIEQMELAQNMSKHCETNKCNRSDNELLCATNIRNLENYISESSFDKEPSSSICCPSLSNNETCVTYRYHSDRTKSDASQDNYKLKSPTWLKCYASSDEGPTGNQNLDDVVDERVKYRTNFNGTLLQVLYLPWEDIPHNIVGVKLSPDFVLAADDIKLPQTRKDNREVNRELDRHASFATKLSVLRADTPTDDTGQNRTSASQ